MSDEAYNREISAIYGWRPTDDGRVEPPAVIMPKCAINRVEWANQWMLDGLTFLGAINAVLAEASDIQAEFELGGTWMPVTKEFEKWRDEPSLHGIRQVQVALALIYGNYEATDAQTK